MEEKEKQNVKSTPKKVLSIVGNTLLWLFVAFAVLMTIFAITSRSNVDNVPSIGGKIIAPIVTDSMKPTFKSGDLLICDKLKTLDDQLSLEEGDVVQFRARRDLNGDGKNDLIAHRIIKVNYQDDGVTVKNYDLKGDNDAGVETVNPVDVVSKWNGTKIPGVGKFIFFLQTFLGFGLLIVLPLVLFFILELVIFIRKYLEIKNAGKKKITAADEELIKQKAIEEYLRKQQEEKAAKAEEEPQQETEEPKADQPEETKAEEPKVEEKPYDGDALEEVVEQDE